jgi:hypothetical protein
VSTGLFPLFRIEILAIDMCKTYFPMCMLSWLFFSWSMILLNSSRIGGLLIHCSTGQQGSEWQTAYQPLRVLKVVRTYTSYKWRCVDSGSSVLPYPKHTSKLSHSPSANRMVSAGKVVVVYVLQCNGTTNDECRMIN